MKLFFGSAIFLAVFTMRPLSAFAATYSGSYSGSSIPSIPISIIVVILIAVLRIVVVIVRRSNRRSETRYPPERKAPPDTPVSANTQPETTANETMAAETRPNEAVKTEVHLEELKKTNPIEYKRSIVASAAGFKDFASMVSSDPALDRSLAFATSDKDLSKVAVAYGYKNFKEMYQASLEKKGLN